MTTATSVEREIKLAFESADAARAAVVATGATPLLGRRLQEDALLDTADEQLRQRRCVLRVLRELGLSVWFRYEKYREEFAHEDVIVAIDETPVGVFVEIEGSEPGIASMAKALGRSQDDYVVDSYRALFLQHGQSNGLTGRDMVFDAVNGRA